MRFMPGPSLSFCLLATVALPVAGDGQQRSPDASPPPGVLLAFRIHDPVILDGRLEESFWSIADSISDFRQREPSSGVEASELTVVRVVRDEKAMYVGVRAYDSDSRGIRATQLRRDDARA